MSLKRTYRAAAQWAALLILSLASAAAQTSPAAAPDNQLSVVTTPAFILAANELAPKYEQLKHVQVKLETGGSVGTTGTAIPARVLRDEPIDVIILYDAALNDLIKAGKVLPDSKVDLVLSDVGIAVKAGAPKPDISTVDALKKTLLAAKVIAYTSGVSGVYVEKVLFPKLGIADQMKPKTRLTFEATSLVAKGEADLVFQQISELMPVKGIEIVGPLPPGAQEPTIFSAGIPLNAPHPIEARELIQWLASPAAYDAIRKGGLQPFMVK